MQTATPMQIQTAFGERVRLARQATGASQERLAERASLHRTYIGSLELGKRNVSLVNIVKVARALELDPAELVSGL